MRHWLISFVFVFFYYFVITTCSEAKGPSILIDISNGRVLEAENAFDRWYPASLTKLMTVYIVFRTLDLHLIDLNTPIHISKRAERVPPTKMGYRHGDVIPVDTAIKGLLVRSANDVAIALAEKIAGSVDHFITLMNNQAELLGMDGTHFNNPTGLPDPKNYTTAKDIALLVTAIRRNFPHHAHYFNIIALTAKDETALRYNINPLIGRFLGADGMKTGFICDSGFNLVASATRKNRTLAAITFGNNLQASRAEIAAAMLERGFQKDPKLYPNLKYFSPSKPPNTNPPSLKELTCGPHSIEKDQFNHDHLLLLNSPFVKNKRPITTGEIIEYLIKVPRPTPKKRSNLKKHPVPVPTHRRRIL